MKPNQFNQHGSRSKKINPMTGRRFDYETEQLAKHAEENRRAEEQRAVEAELQLLERTQVAKEAADDLLTYARFTMPDPANPSDPRATTYNAQPFHKEVARAMEAVERGEIQRLIFCVPPRHGKTELATKRFTAWMSGRHPEWNIAVGTYADSLAEDIGADVRNIMMSPQHRQVFPNHGLQKGGSSKSNMLTTGNGRLVFVGRGTGLTGKGAHCFPAGTKVITDLGVINIEQLGGYVGRCKVLSFDKSNGALSYEDLQGFTDRPRSRLCRLITAGGRVVEATGDHKFWSGGRYKEVRLLAAGDPLLCTVPPERARADGWEVEEDYVVSVEATDKYAVVYDIQVGRNHNFFANGVGCSNCLLIDDILKDFEEARSQTIRDQAWNWFTKVALTRLMGRKLVVVTMTRWHSDDLVGRLTDPENPHYNAIEAAKWKIIRLPAIAEDDDPLGREPGEPLWPEAFDADFLASQQRIDPLGFAALYQQTPTVADGTLFKRETIQRYEPNLLPDGLRYYATSDHALGTKQRNDPSCFLKGGVDNQGNLWLTEMFWQRIPSDRAVEMMLEMGAGSDTATRPLLWWAERGHISKSIGPFLQKRMLETGRYINVQEVTPVVDKEQRAQSIAARVALGKVYFPKGALWDKAIEELMAFPNGLHDDFVDALSLFGLGLTSQFGKAERVEKKEPRFGTWAWVKAEDAARSKAVNMRNGGF